MFEFLTDKIRLEDPFLDGLLLLGVGLVLLIVGAEAFVLASVQVARRLGLSRFTVGVTLVAVGTSLPELATSLVAVLGEGEKGGALAVGNALGSNAANIGLVLGLAALVKPVLTGTLRTWLHLSVMVVSAGVFAAVAYTSGILTRPVALGFLGGFFLYTGLLFRPRMAAWPGTNGLDAEKPGQAPISLVYFLLFLLGALMVWAGSETLVTGALGLAVHFEVSTGAIGAAVVAVGTSIPELAVCFSAARRKEPGILLGNLIGSNIANILLVLGTVSLVGRIVIVDNALKIYTPAMLVFTILMVIVVVSGRKVTRAEGLGLLVLYAAYQVVVWIL